MSTGAQTPRRGGLAAGLTVLFSVLAVIMAFPQIQRIASESFGDHADGAFFRWVMRWNIHAFTDSEDTLFNTNIFWPAQDTLAYSDPLVLPTPVHWLLTSIFGDPAGYNLTYLLTWVAALWSAFLLAKWFSRDAATSVLAAIAFTFAAPRLSHFGHFQLHFSFLIPLSIYFLLRFIETDRWRYAVLTGLCVAGLTITTLYYAVALAIIIGVLSLWGLFIKRKTYPRYLAGIMIAAGISLLIAGPIAFKYLRVHEDVSFRRGAAQEFAAHPADFLSPAQGSYLYGGLESRAARRGGNAETHLFPGFIAVTLGIAGLVTMLGPRRAEPDRPRKLQRQALIPLIAVATLFFILSFGHTVKLGGWTLDMPYEFFEDHVPGFSGLRATSRFVIVPLCIVGVFVAIGFNRLTSKLKGQAKTVATVVVGALMMLEYAAPIHSVRKLDDPAFTAANMELSALPEGPVVELPMGDPRELSWPRLEPPRMVLSSIDWHPRVNGYSGFFPDGYVEIVSYFNSLAKDVDGASHAHEALDVLEVRYLVLRTIFVGDDEVTADSQNPDFTYDSAEVERVLTSLGPERIEFVRRLNGAVLIGLKEA